MTTTQHPTPTDDDIDDEVIAYLSGAIERFADLSPAARSIVLRIGE